MSDKQLSDRYLDRLRRVDEDTALRRVRATAADLRVWRREPDFREAERGALAAPKATSRCIGPAEQLGLLGEDAVVSDAMRERVAGIAERIRDANRV
jgi:hypothetical protein